MHCYVLLSNHNFADRHFSRADRVVWKLQSAVTFRVGTGSWTMLVIGSLVAITTRQIRYR